MNKNFRFLGVLLVALLLGGCATPGGWYDDWGKCAVAAGLVGATMGAIEESEAAAAGAVGGAAIGGALCALLDVNEEEPVVMDSDGDGVLDSMDQCPGTPPGVAVDSVGCRLPEMVMEPEPEPEPEIIVLEGVNFHHDSSILTSASSARLDKAVATLKAHPDLNVAVVGHTDSDGNADYNQWLSERRAQAVMDYLVSHGVNAANLSAVGYGEDQPIADNSTKEGKAKNRRVELHIQ